MSNLDRGAVPAVCGGRGLVVAEPVRELLGPRRVKLGASTEVRRLHEGEVLHRDSAGSLHGAPSASR